jgi:hypothetical protein
VNHTSIIFAVFAVFAYTLYARKYDDILEQNPRPILSAILLYLLSSVLLLFLVGITSLVYKTAFSDFVAPTHTQLIGWQLTGSKDVFIDIGVSIALMSVGYATHIYTEARSRQSPHFGIGLYAIVFQLNTVVIVLLNQLVTPKSLHPLAILGAVMVLLFSVLPFFRKVSRIENKIIILALISAISCGGSLFIDGNIVRQVVFQPTFSWSQSPLFLFYEFLTFFIPSLIVATALAIRIGIPSVFQQLRTEIKRKKSPYYWSTLGSVGQFVGSVFALAVDTAPLVVPSILAITPLVNVIFDKKQLTPTEKTMEYISAFGILMGLIFVTKFS